jgi:hypothetical protein
LGNRADIIYRRRERNTMANISPNKFVLRCYGHKTEKGNWFGVCLNFNLAIEADSREELKLKMREVVTSYVDTILDTNDKGSMANLFTRKAPLKDWAIYYLIGFENFIKSLPEKFTFKELVPFHLASNC